MEYECEAYDDLMDPWHQKDDSKELIRVFVKEMGVTFHEGQAENDTFLINGAILM